MTDTLASTKSYYDPQVEFLEIGYQDSERGNDTFWKFYGPDQSGTYGGLQGSGGLVAVMRESNQAVEWAITDLQGNTLGALSGSTVQWRATNIDSYGLSSDYRTQTTTTPQSLLLDTFWQGHRMDPTGLYLMGARYYDPYHRRFMSPDPLGFGSDPTLYCYADFDPVNGMDPTGRQTSGPVNLTGGSMLSGGANRETSSLLSAGLSSGSHTPTDIEQFANHVMGVWDANARHKWDLESGRITPMQEFADNLANAVPTGVALTLGGLATYATGGALAPLAGGWISSTLVAATASGVGGFATQISMNAMTPGASMGENLIQSSVLSFGIGGGLQLVGKGLSALGNAGNRVGSSELGNALSGLGRNPLGRNLNTLDEFGPGAGFSGVYDVGSKKFLAYPSGATRLANGGTPLNLVEQFGGHEDVNKALSGLLKNSSNNRLGFSMTMDDAGNFGVGWNSRTINLANPSFPGHTVPSELRQRVLDAIIQSTGRIAR